MKRLDAAIRIPYTLHFLGGSITPRTRRLHAKYGHVVRIAPDTLSYTCSEAWNGMSSEISKVELSLIVSNSSRHIRSKTKQHVWQFLEGS